MTDDPAPSRMLATIAITFAMVVWAITTAVSVLALLASQLWPFSGGLHHDAVHTPWPVMFGVLAVSSVVVIVLLVRAADGSGRAAMVAALLTVGLALWLAIVTSGPGLAVVLLPVAAALVLAIPQINRHAEWKARHRPPELPRARVR